MTVDGYEHFATRPRLGACFKIVELQLYCNLETAPHIRLYTSTPWFKCLRCCHSPTRTTDTLAMGVLGNLQTPQEASRRWQPMCGACLKNHHAAPTTPLTIKQECVL